MTTVYCDCNDCYNNDDGQCALDNISMSGRMTGGGWLTLCNDYQEINREDFEPHESEDLAETFERDWEMMDDIERSEWSRESEEEE